MTLHKKAWIFSSLIAICGLLTFIVVEHIAGAYGFTVQAAVALLWLAPAMLQPFFFKCPRCGTSIFCRAGSRSLWKTDKMSYYPQQIVPVKRCARCGKDHTVPD